MATKATERTFHGPFTTSPADIYSAAVVSNDGILDELLAVNDVPNMHVNGASKMASYLRWDHPDVKAPATTLLGMLAGVDHPMADKAIRAIRDGLRRDWSDGWARRQADGTPETWGEYRTENEVLVRAYRGRYNRVRFFDATGTQHGPEQANVAPAVAFAHATGWTPLWG